MFLTHNTISCTSQSRAPSTASGRPLRPAAAVPTPKKTGGRPPRPQAQDRSSSMAPAPTKKAGRPSNQQIDHTRTLLARSSAKPVASSARGRAGGAATLKAPGRPPRSAARKQVKAQSQDILVQAGALPPAAAPPPAPHGGGITTMPAPPTAATRTPAPRAPLNVVQPAAPTVARAALIARPQGEMGRKTNNNGSRIGFSGQEVLGLTDGLWHSAIVRVLCTTHDIYSPRTRTGRTCCATWRQSTSTSLGRVNRSGRRTGLVIRLV
jgi:hypothetical protein